MLKQAKRNNVILLEDGNLLSWEIAKRYRKVYVYSGDLRKGYKIPSDILNHTDLLLSNYQAGCQIDWVYNKYIKSSEIKFLNEIIGDGRAHFGIKKNILLALGRLFYSFILAENFIKQYEIKESIDFVPASFSFSLYRIFMQKKDLIPKNINIPGSYIKTMKRREAIENILYRAKLILYPLWVLLKMSIRKSALEPIKKIRFGIHVWDSWSGSIRAHYRMDLLEGGDGINPNNALYIIDGDITKSNLLKIKSNGYNSCCFKEMLRHYQALQYVKEKFFYHLKLCLRCFSIGKDGKSLLTESYLRAMQTYILWEIFYTRYYVDIFITLQEPGNIYRVLVQKKRGAKCLYVFWSTSYDHIYRKDMNAHFISYYSFMIYDAMISSLTSIEYFKKNNNFIAKYINVGVLRSDVVFQMKHNSELKADMRKKIGVPLNKKVIGFFDTSVGQNGIFTNCEGSKMLDDVYRLLESNDEYFIVFKTRGQYDCCGDADAKKAFNRLIEHKRVIYINKLPVVYAAFEVVGACDIAIGAFCGSVTWESVSGGIRTLCYTPERFNKDVFVVNSFPRFCVYNYDDLKKNVDYWLYQCNEEDFYNFQRVYINKHIDSYCDGKAKERLHSVLRQSIKC